MYIINMFGTGVRYWVCEIPMDRFDEMESFKQKNHCSWEEIFFDLHLLKKWGYTELDELHVVLNERGWLLGGDNYMELRTNGKRKGKYGPGDL